MGEGIEIRFEFDGDLSAAIGRVIAAGNDLTPVMREIATHLEATSALSFEREASPAGVPWKPSQRVIEEGGQTLTLTTDLRTSITSGYGRDFAEAGPERSFGAAVYAAIHQFGGIIVPRFKQALAFGGRVLARVVMPARPYVGFRPDDPATFAEMLRGHFREAWSGGGGA